MRRSCLCLEGNLTDVSISGKTVAQSHDPSRGLDAWRLDQDADCGTLWRLAVTGAPTLMVEVVNHSPDPDGRYRHFFLQVHPELRPILPDGAYGMRQLPTARNAVASTFGLSGAEYRPEVET